MNATKALSGSLLVFTGLKNPAKTYGEVKQHIPGTTTKFIDDVTTGQIAHAGVVITGAKSSAGSRDAASEFGLKKGDLLVCETWADQMSRDKLYENELAEALRSTKTDRPTMIGDNQIGCMITAQSDAVGINRPEDTHVVVMGWPESTGLDPALYLQATPRIVPGVANIPRELLYHVAFSFRGQRLNTGRLLIVEVWTDQEAQQEFMAEQVGPVIEPLGIPEPPLQMSGHATGLCLPEDTVYAVNA
jgi:hypothetical protein